MVTRRITSHVVATVVMATLCSCVINTIINDDPDAYDQPPALGVCNLPWRPILKLDNTGAVVKGSIETVRDMALEGNLFRIKLDRPEGPYLLNADNVNVRGDHACAESMWHVSDNGTHISTSVEWLYHLMCTNGQISIIASPYSRPDGWVPHAFNGRRADAAANFGSMSNLSVPMVWYVKELGPGNPVYSHYLDGSPAKGKMKHLVKMATLGETHIVMRDRGYTTTLNNLVVNEDLGEINGQSLGHVGQQFTKDAIIFRSPPYYWYSSWTTNGQRDNARFYVGTVQSRGHNHDFVALDWHVDSCWREVYVSTAWGDAKRGSLDELIFHISVGHRVRIHFNNKVLEATSVRISDRTVIAQCIEELQRRETIGKDKYFFNSETMWKWTTAHTTGKVKVYISRVKTMEFWHKLEQKHEIRWMVDTRKWERVYSWPPTPYVNRDDLINAVKSGASIRFNLQQDLTAGFFFTNADNVRYDEASDTVYAQCLRHVSDKRDLINSNEYEIQPKPFHWFLMISSDGVMAMSAWKTLERTQLYDSVAPAANITWYASR